MAAFFRVMAYSVWFVCALVGFVYLSIPTDKVKTWVAHQATVKMKTKVTIAGLQLHGISGVSLTGVKIVIPIPDEPGGGPGGTAAGGPAKANVPAAKAAKHAKGKQDSGKQDSGRQDSGKQNSSKEDSGQTRPSRPRDGILLLNEVRVDLNTTGLAMGKTLRAVLNAEFSGGGNIENATLVAKKHGFELNLPTLTGINLTPTKLFKKLVGIDIHTRLSGAISLNWVGKIVGSTGKIELTLTDTVIPHLPIKIPPSPYPVGEAFSVQVGEITVQARLDKASALAGVRGSATTLLVDKLEARGEHILLQLDSGQKNTIAFVGPKTADAQVDLKFSVHFTDAFFAWKGDGVRSDGSIAKNESHAAMKSVLASALRRNRVRLGNKYWYGFHCKGRLSASKDGRLKAFQCRPEAPSRRISPNMGGNKKPGVRPSANGVGTRPKPGMGATARPTPRGLARPITSSKPPTSTTSRPVPPRRLNRGANPNATRPAGRLVERRAPDDARHGWKPTRPQGGTGRPGMLAPEGDDEEVEGGGGEPTETVLEPDEPAEGDEVLDEEEAGLPDEPGDDDEADLPGENGDDEGLDGDEGEPEFDEE